MALFMCVCVCVCVHVCVYLLAMGGAKYVNMFLEVLRPSANNSHADTYMYVLIGYKIIKAIIVSHLY